MKYVIRTLGCKANLYDSQLLEAELMRRGHLSAGACEADLCIVNSCTVTDEADRQSRKLAARLSRENPGAAVVVTGCAAEVDPERIAASAGIHYVIGNRDKSRLVDLILHRMAQQGGAGSRAGGEILGAAEGYAQMLSRHPLDREWPLLDHGQGGVGAAKTRAFLRIQEGCNSFCTYCVIPYARGPSRSLKPREILERVIALAGEGVREVVITGTNIGDYGTDWAETPQLAALLEQIFKHTPIERLRVSSLDPTEITEPMLRLMENQPRFCPHFHVSLQSASDRVLRLMKRRYGYAEVARCLNRIHAIAAPAGGLFCGMDVIAGFPGETDDEFRAGVQALEALPWTRLHVFPFSERRGTPATRLPGSLPQAERLRRVRELNALSLRRMLERSDRILSGCERTGTPVEGVLFEKPMPAPEALRARFPESSEWAAGYSPNYTRVLVPCSGRLDLRNSVRAVRPDSLWVDPVGNEVSLIASLMTPDT